MGDNGEGRGSTRPHWWLWLFMSSCPALTSSFYYPITAPLLPLKAQPSAFLFPPLNPLLPSRPAQFSPPRLRMRPATRLSSLRRVGSCLLFPPRSSFLSQIPPALLGEQQRRHQTGPRSLAMSSSTINAGLGQELMRHASEKNLSLEPLERDFFSSLVLVLRRHELQGTEDIPADRATRSLYCNSLILSLASKGLKAGRVSKSQGNGFPMWPDDALLTCVADVLSVRLVCHKQGQEAAGASEDFMVFH